MDPARLAPQTKSQTEPKQQSDRVSAVGRVPSRLTADDWKGHRCAVRPPPAPPRRSVTRSPPITVPTPCHCGHTQTRLTSGADWLEWVTEVSSSERVSTVDPSCVVARVHPASIDGSDRGSATWGDATTGSHRAHRSPAKPPACELGSSLASWLVLMPRSQTGPELAEQGLWPSVAARSQSGRACVIS